MAPRIHRPECWGPLTPTDLLRKLAAEDTSLRDMANRHGQHPSPAAYIAWQGLKEDYSAGRPLRPARLPFHAQRITERLQLQRCDW
jgi:hypothetical protein